ncbi:NRDE family protein [Rhodocista pekingensis]|uniref:NRDE family protein n=1 Tax=Rhodocista pekingensis TaxID=201185 RepID=A0ABW2KX32_9PROT
MCSVVILRRPGHPWPVVLGANRDERLDRPWKPPARHWPDREDVVAGLDEAAGGSWMGLNDAGLVACILNREGTLGREDGKRSRGELVLEALDHADADAAARALSHLDVGAYRPFNLVLADNRDAFFLSHRGESHRGERPRGRVRVEPILEGLSMVTAADLNDAADSPRIRFFRPLFQAAPPPDPDSGAGDWSGWEALLGSRIWDGDAGPRGAMCVVTPVGFGTTNSSLLALPAMDRPGTRPVWRFAPGSPDRTPFAPVAL